MTQAAGKRPRLRLDPHPYARLRQQVLERDAWRCQFCGGLSNLEVHHKTARSKLGDDSVDNLITLCDPCHKELHRAPRKKLQPRSDRQ